jgi:glutathione S-transferase
MTDIILHHYDTSPYAEKVRTGLGLKGLAWASVELPQIMPKPNLTALTGGYRKTPVLQIGADIYCDSQLIMRELERRHPTPSFYPAGRGAADARSTDSGRAILPSGRAARPASLRWRGSQDVRARLALPRSRIG